MITQEHIHWVNWISEDDSSVDTDLKYMYLLTLHMEKYYADIL